MKKYKAFSLVELSVVILITGLVIAGVLKGVKLINSAKLVTAQTATKKSPVLETENLLLWYESSLLSSFIQTEKTDGGVISTWYDNSPKLASDKINATQATGANKPTFIATAINNSLPALRFNGSSSYLSFDGSALIGSNYTIFVVEQRRSNGSTNYFIGGTGTSANQNLSLGYEANTTIRTSQYDSDLDFTVPSYTSPTPTIHTVTFSASNGKNYWNNGGNNADSSNSSYTTALTSYSGSSIGKLFGSNFFNGDVAEIIIFNKTLKDSDRKSIEAYLSKKYNIAITN